MKKYFIFCSLLILFNAEAVVISAKSNNSLHDPQLINICQQMGSNHLNDIKQLHGLYQDFISLITTEISLVNSEKITSLSEQIKVLSEKIQYLTKPEWNYESIPVYLTWTIPYNIFFDDSAYLNNKREIKAMQIAVSSSRSLGFKPNSPIIDAGVIIRYRHGININSLDLDTQLLSKNNIVFDKKIKKAFFLNSENEDVKNYLFINPNGLWRSDNEEDESFVIVYKKEATAIEACQFLNTLAFEIEIDYAESFFTDVFDERTIYKNKKTIVLTYNNGTENEF